MSRGSAAVHLRPSEIFADQFMLQISCGEIIAEISQYFMKL